MSLHLVPKLEAPKRRHASRLVARALARTVRVRSVKPLKLHRPHGPVGRSSTPIADASEREALLVADRRLRMRVEAALARDPRLSSSDVQALAHDGRVLLTGIVPRDALARRAERLLFSVEGVRQVQNSIEVERGRAAVRFLRSPARLRSHLVLLPHREAQRRQA